MFSETVDRDGDSDVPQVVPLDGNRNHAAGHHQRLHSLLAQGRKDATELAMPHQWLAADDRQVNRLVFGDEPEDPVNELVAPGVVQLSERDAATEMSVFV